MPSDTYSPNLGLLLMADGNDVNTWGDNTNNNLQLIENAISQRTDIAIGGLGTGTQQYTLSTTVGATNQARCISIHATGALNGNVQVIVPNVPRLYVFDNQTSGAYVVSVQTATPTATVTCTQGQATAVYCDGNGSCKSVFPSGGAANLSGNNLWTAGQSVQSVQWVMGTPIAINCALSNNFWGQLTANGTFSITNPLDGQEIVIIIQQDATGSRIPTWQSNVQWAQGITPTFTVIPLAYDMVRMRYFAGTTATPINLWFAELVPDYAAVSGASYNITISSDQFNYNLNEELNYPTAAVTVNLTVQPGVIIKALCNQDYAMDLSGLPTGSTVNLYNYGHILGAGGDGGNGGMWSNISSSIAITGAAAAFPGGPALKCPASGTTCSIYNTFTLPSGQIVGYIWAGGGGGGGGGFTAATDGSGGGGGGGAGGGRGGQTLWNTTGTAGAGTPGTGGSNKLGSGANGTGGAGNNAGAGGNGGDWGQVGLTGTGTGPGLPWTTAVTGYQGTGGQPIAVYYNGNTLANFTGNDGPSGTHIKGLTQ